MIEAAIFSPFIEQRRWPFLPTADVMLQQKLATTQQELTQSWTRISDMTNRLTAMGHELDIARQQSNPPPDLLTQITNGLSPGDKTRLAEVLFDDSQILDDTDALFASANTLAFDFRRAMGDGSIADDISQYCDRLLSVQIEAKVFTAKMTKVKDKWRYYQTQQLYVFTENPENNSNLLYNGAAPFLSFVHKWMKVNNKNEVIDLLDAPQSQFMASIRNFMGWVRGCRDRLSNLRHALQSHD